MNSNRQKMDITSLRSGPDDFRGPHPYIRPKDAAALIIIDTSQGSPRILMGKRNESLKFMPGKYVFPGGRVDIMDSRMKTPDDLPAKTMRLLLEKMKGHPKQSRARTLGLTALREVFEETGIVIGTQGQLDLKSPPALWHSFLASGYIPSLSNLFLVARAITPPGRIRRYDTRFFCADARNIAFQTNQTDGEFSNLEWVTFEQAQSLDIPLITRLVLEEIQVFTKSCPLSDKKVWGSQDVPFFYVEKGIFFREILK